jgi:DNA-binding NarL/FixJ family response regulator
MSIQQALRATREQNHGAGAVCRVFELGLGERRNTPPLSSRQLAIGRLMETGAKDAAIARQVGLSLRTVQSEISALISALGARSRFQAGCLLVRHFG